MDPAVLWREGGIICPLQALGIQKKPRSVRISLIHACATHSVIVLVTINLFRRASDLSHHKEYCLFHFFLIHQVLHLKKLDDIPGKHMELPGGYSAENSGHTAK